MVCIDTQGRVEYPDPYESGESWYIRGQVRGYATDRDGTTYLLVGILDGGFDLYRGGTKVGYASLIVVHPDNFTPDGPEWMRSQLKVAV